MWSVVVGSEGQQCEGVKATRNLSPCRAVCAYTDVAPIRGQGCNDKIEHNFILSVQLATIITRALCRGKVNACAPIAVSISLSMHRHLCTPTIKPASVCTYTRAREGCLETIARNCFFIGRARVIRVVDKTLERTVEETRVKLHFTLGVGEHRRQLRDVHLLSARLNFTTDARGDKSFTSSSEGDCKRNR